MSPNASLEIARLADLTLDQLVDKYAEVHNEKCRSRNRRFLVRRIAWRIQANEEGGLSDRALLRSGPIADESLIRVTPPKPKVGGDVVRTKAPDGWDMRIPPPGQSMRVKASSLMGTPYSLRRFFNPQVSDARGTWCSPFVASVLVAGGHPTTTSQSHTPQRLFNTIGSYYQFVGRVRR